MTSVAASFFASLSMPAPGGSAPAVQPTTNAFGAMLIASPASVAAPSPMPVDAGLQGAMIATLLASTADAAFAPPALTSAAAVAPTTLDAPQSTADSEPAPLAVTPVSVPTAHEPITPAEAATPGIAPTMRAPVASSKVERFEKPAPTLAKPLQAAVAEPRQQIAPPITPAAPAPTATAPSETVPPRDAADVRPSPTLATEDQTLRAREYGLVRPTRPLSVSASAEAAAPAATSSGKVAEAATSPVAAPPLITIVQHAGADPVQTVTARRLPASDAAQAAPRPATEGANQNPLPAVAPTAEPTTPIVKSEVPVAPASAPLSAKAPASVSTIAQTKPTLSQRADETLAEPAVPDAKAPTVAAPAVVTPTAPAIGEKAEPETIEHQETETPELPAAEPAMLNPALLAAQPTVVAAVVQPERATPAPEADEREAVTGEQPVSPEEPIVRSLVPDPAPVAVPVQLPEAAAQPKATLTAQPGRDGAPAPSARLAQPATAPLAAPADPLAAPITNDRGEAPASPRDEPPTLRAAVPAERAPTTPRDPAPQFTLPTTPGVSAPPAQPSAPATITAQPGRMGQELGVTIAHHVAGGAATGGGETITLRLNPVDMGQIDVKLSFDEGGTLRAVVSADNPAALEMLRRDSADLGRALSDAGVRADTQTLRFDTRAGTGQSGGDSRSGDQHAPRQPEPPTGLAADATDDITPIHRPLRTRGGVDMVA